MHDMRKALDIHEPIHGSGQRIADTVNVVPCQVNQHDVFSAVLEGRTEFLGEFVVLFGSLTTLDRSCDGVGNDTPILGLDEQFRRRTYELEVGAINIEQVRRGVDSSEMTVNIERMQSCWSGEPLRRNSLDDIAPCDMLL
jgi:hypothetical protein